MTLSIYIYIGQHYLVPGFQIGIWSPASNLHRGERAPEPSESRRTPGFPPLVVFLSLQFPFFFFFPTWGRGSRYCFRFFSFFRPGSWGSWLVAFYNRIQRLANLFDLVPLSARWKEFLIPYYIITDLFELSCDKSFLLSFIAVELGKASNLHSHLVVVTTSICFIHQWLVCLYHV